MKRILLASLVSATLASFGAFAQVAQTTTSDSNQTTVVKHHGKEVKTNSNTTNSTADSTGASTTTSTAKNTKSKRHHGKEVTHSSETQTTAVNP